MILSQIEDLSGKQPGVPRIVIIGAGAVGIYSAIELSKKGFEIILVESGGTELGSFSESAYRSVGRKHEGIAVGRSRTFGGTTNLWGGQLVEFQRMDFAGRDWIPDSKWPVDFDDIRPFYATTYKNLGIPDELQNDRCVYDKTSFAPHDFGENLEYFLTRWLRVPNFVNSFRDRLKEDPNISILLHHTVLDFCGSEDSVTEVKVIDKSKRMGSISGDTFILANGTIEISRLLIHALRSSHWDCPWKDNTNLGKYFQDHLGGRIASVTPVDQRKFFRMFSTLVKSGNKFQPKLRTTDKLLHANSILNFQGSFVFESSASEHLIYLKQFLKATIFDRELKGIGEFLMHGLMCAKYLPPLAWKYIVQNRVFIPSTSKISYTFQGEQLPIRQSSISIDYDTTDEFGLPMAVLDWKIGSEELKSIRDFALLSQKILSELGIAELEIDQNLHALNPKYLDSLIDNYHLVGGTRMGFSPEDGVVDKNLKVFGTDNLYIAGAATFRTTSSANTTFVALAFSTRLADHIADQPKKPL